MLFLFFLQLTNGGRIRQYSLRDTGRDGWELHEEEDRQTVRTSRYTDWHHAERAVALIRLASARLEEQGWVIARQQSTVG